MSGDLALPYIFLQKPYPSMMLLPYSWLSLLFPLVSGDIVLTIAEGEFAKSYTMLILLHGCLRE